MKRGRGGDSVEAIKAVWMEGYDAGRRVPVVRIASEDLTAVYEPGHCAHPESCPCTTMPNWVWRLHTSMLNSISLGAAHIAAAQARMIARAAFRAVPGLRGDK